MTLLLLACSPRIPDPLPDEPAVDYVAEHRQWTRELQLVVDLETRLMMEATLITPQLAEAQALTLARARMDGPEEYQARREVLALAVEPGWNLLITTTGTARSDDTLSLDGSEDWTLQLKADGRRLEPVYLDELREPSANELLIYPQIDRWARVWSARFDYADADTLELVVAGPRGAGSVSWELR